MSKQRIIPLIVFIAFAIWTAILSHNYNFLSFFKPIFASGPATQVLTDLTIAITMVLIWIYKDAAATNRKFWPYLVITIFLGSFGPLLYFILRKEA